MSNQFNYNRQNARVIDQRSKTSVIQSNKVLRNTYLLLSLTLLLSALTAGWSMMIGAPVISPILTLILYFALLFGIQATRNSPIGLVLTFVLTGFLGFTLGPILNFYITTFSNGSELIMMALGATGAIFLGLSAIALNPNRDFTRLGPILGVGALVALVAIVVNLFLQMPALYLALSVIVAFISAGFILWQTNQIVRGGETNYIMATVTIYISILNIFMTILQFLGMFAGNRN
ncbi:Bax inhibitor-1/YccA family protein [Fangia hongkongensis]|uniref:Bax inhibitor-1/YccA family protein n=1 Tax=Fangia hongkongensis TaxID=270495 RepID=UPI0003622F4B|nr:Bax inhibitor-1/YccA family protein [Fangia hongkongensis]MBK2124285.1 Bax inhibitor-1/YccA family protein [Fangia hongkongensis]